jgi:hypothetical protein
LLEESYGSVVISSILGGMFVKPPLSATVQLILASLLQFKERALLEVTRSGLQDSGL